MFKKIGFASLVAGALVASGARADTTLRLVEVITSPPRTEFLKKQLAEFEKANPGIKVEVVSLPWGQAFEKFLTMVQAGDTPDVAEMPERWMGLYGANGQLEDLGPMVKTWPDYATLGESARHFGSVVDNKLYSIPYGFYIRAMFWNKKLFAAAGLAGPPKTIDEFMEDNKKISALPGKYGYCLRGGPGGFTGAQMFMMTLNGKPGYFNADGTSTFDEPGSVKGLALLGEIYQKGYAPKDSVGWGFNEIVAGFYSGTCAMLDQDPDALLGVAEKMSKDDFAVAPMPLGPAGKSFPSIGYSGWAMFSASKAKPEAFKLIAFLSSPKNNIEWAKFVGVLPIHNGANNDPFFSSEQFSGWFEELKSPDKYVFVAPPSHLENLGQFFDQMAPRGIQQVLLAQRPAGDVAADWAKFLTAEQKAWMAKNPK
jgi:multiple sugar transport system substrate-binding protein